METRGSAMPRLQARRGTPAATPKDLARLAAQKRRRSGFGCNFPPLGPRGTAGPATPARSGLLGLIFSPPPGRGPSTPAAPAGTRAASGRRHPGRQHAGHPYTGGTEGEAKKGERGRHFHGQEDQIWGGERTGKTRKFKKEPLLPPWLTFPLSSGQKKKRNPPFSSLNCWSPA